ncbi:hypothetical protein Q3W71_27065 [Micromonospora sp. C28SCA-DRY-2]|uniref:hypothetical protein n=1 Tax=Micromonospora sp. C28SCA-DRY-2 TaxID=3059522 RepID=UPI0026770BFB|nr:hypothetical protein [Micromonospora sp. C28SCA-DRY-2]MDO3705338.1 hypothetical protein [Micromonospora sp. C28SCA-DRY-2]
MRETLTPSTVVPAPPPAAHPAGGGRHLLRHLGEMVLAMVAGMLLLGPVWTLVGEPLGIAATLARPDVAALVMATNMTVGMTVWMRHRRHSWAATGEMAAAMYLPFLLLFGPYWAGLLGADALMLGGHLLMLPAMVLVAVRHRHAEPVPVRRHPAVVALARRWPTLVALLMTVSLWAAPDVPSPWLMLVLPGAYLLIGAVRGRLRGPGGLGRQLVGLAAWSALVAVAVVVDGRTAAWLVAAGWLAHAGWDLLHHRRDEVVPRAYAEWCGVLDAAIGVSVVLAILSG